MRVSDVVRREKQQRRAATLDYMQTMLSQLRQMAEAERCDMLAYLIDMAYVEASDLLRRERATNSRENGSGTA